MFLDPDPKRAKQARQGTHGMSAPSGFFSSQRPIVSPRDHRTTIRRKTQPLAERTPSQNNQRNPWSDPDNSTVRLVKPSPLRLADRSSETDDDDENDGIPAVSKENTQGQQVSPEFANAKPASVSNLGLPGFSTSSLAQSVSGSYSPVHEAQEIGRHDTTSLLYTTPAPVHSATQAGPRTAWHRRSGSTGNYSTSSTLKGAEDSGIFIPSIEKGDSRLSESTTARGTPTPTEKEIRQYIEANEQLRQTSVHTLETLQEASPERSTLRAVEVSSEEGDSVGDPSESSSSPNFRVYASPSSSEVDPRSSNWDRLTDDSPTRIRRLSDTRTPRPVFSQETILRHEPVFPPSSSPNYVAYSPDSTRPRSGTYPLHRTYSIESIESRLQYPSIVRPQTGLSVASTTSWSSRPSSSRDQITPLYVPKKRLRHKAASSSLNAAANASFASGRSMDEDYDTLPYPREQFSSHLSTIASESDRTGSQQLSHFSLGSGILTGDDASSIPLSGTWPRRRRESAPVSSFASDNPPETSSGEDAGDMTLGMFREESAKPQPLFEPRAGAVPGERRYSGSLPPLPPIPRSRDSDEHADRVTELQAPQLREKRSGYSLRRRSNSTPSGAHSRHLSRSESDRWSQASSLFPTWAKNFYGNGAALMSASKISLTNPPTPQRGHLNKSHARSDSHWTERSITSRLGTGYSEVGPPSPTASSHFLPSIFRPRGRKDGSSSKKRKSKRSRPSGDSPSRPDSMQIFNDPLSHQAGEPSTLPSGHPKYGSLKDAPTTSPSDPSHRPLPRKYSKQRHWNEMQFPRPMTKDRLSDFHVSTSPHLAPSKRASHRLSAWRAPSFVESLDTLLKSQVNRQILLFALGFVFPLTWMLGAVLPIPKRPAELHEMSVAGSEDDIQTAMMKHEAGDAEKRWREEKAWAKGRWWRWLNRIMSLVGVGVIAAVIALAIIATR